MPCAVSNAIRAARAADLDAVAALEAACFTCDAQSRRSLRHLLTRAHADFLVCVLDVAIVADVVVLYRRASRVARLYSIAVSDAARGRGIAAALLAAAEARALVQGCTLMRAEARASNHASRALFARAGYRETTPLCDYYQGPGARREDGVRLEKILSPPSE